MEKSLATLVLDLMELDPEAEENKDIIAKSLNALGQKIDSYIGCDKFCDSQIDMLAKEIDHLNKQIVKFENVKKALRERAGKALIDLNAEALKSDNGHKIYLHSSSSVKITDMEKIPDQFKRTQISIEPDKNAIKKALKDGPVAGAELIHNKSVVFK